MPVLDGVAAAREIRALSGSESATPILAPTASPLSEQLATYARVGMNGCISKPVDFAELISKFESCGSARRIGESMAALAG